MSTTVPIVMTVAGSDPSGGAGLQADLKALALAGVYGAAVATAITVQNSLGVKRISAVDPRLLAEQAQAVLADLEVDVIKTGMMASAGNARKLAAILADFAGEVVCDPVLRATDKTDLSHDPDLSATRELVSRATVITPNRGELELLSGGKAPTPSMAVELINTLFRRYPALKAIALKGGHFHENEDSVRDRLFLKDENGEAKEAAHAERTRIKQSPHGTGCVFASLLAGFLARDYGIVSAFGEAGRIMDQLLENTFTPGTGAAFMSFLPGRSPGIPR